jgi:hypothetical protein
MTRDLAKPAERLLEEGGRRHEEALRAGVNRLEDDPDETHVVLEREPAKHHARRGVLERLFDERLVVREVRVRHHHATRIAGRARRVLEDGEVVVGRPRRILVDRRRVERIDGDPRRARELRHEVARTEQVFRGEHEMRSRIGGDPTQACERLWRAGCARCMSRDRADACVEAAEQRIDEGERLREQEESAPLLVFRHRLPQCARDAPRASVELGEGDDLGLANIPKKRERAPIRLRDRVMGEPVDDAQGASPPWQPWQGAACAIMERSRLERELTVI